jgi:hypothetical protein
VEVAEAARAVVAEAADGAEIPTLEQEDPFNGGKAMARTGDQSRVVSLLKPCAALLITVLIIFLAAGPTSAAEPKPAAQKQKTFASAEAAVQALIDALKAGDTKGLSALFGPKGKEIVFSGDPVADKLGRERFVMLYEQKNKLEEAGPDKFILQVGSQGWPFPIPVVKKKGSWIFDVDEGKEELLARRIGGNELSVIQVCLAYVDAQREYALKDRDGDGVLAYAQKLGSSPGKKDGLYWKAKEGEKPSPLGSFAAAAQKQGYKKGAKPTPFHGYYYRILKGQGKDAPGGAYDYVVKGKMIGGFALVAYPAQYGSSGIMTFIVNHDGVVYQKDLGKETEKTAQAMKLFNPDRNWKKVEKAAP